MPYKDPRVRKQAAHARYLRNRERALRTAFEQRERDRANGHVKGRLYDRARVRRLRELIDTAKQKPCADCDTVYPPYVMDFDHVRGRKLFSIGWAITMHVSVAALRREIKKCEVVCANCHRERTHGGKSKE